MSSVNSIPEGLILLVGVKSRVHAVAWKNNMILLTCMNKYLTLSSIQWVHAMAWSRIQPLMNAPASDTNLFLDIVLDNMICIKQMSYALLYKEDMH